MKRRNFIKGICIILVEFTVERFIPVDNNFDNFANEVLKQVCENSGIPKAIFDMEFSKEYSLSKQLTELETARQRKAVLNSYMQMVLKT